AATVNVAHNITAPKSGAAFKVGSTVSFSGRFWDAAGSKHTAQWAFVTSASTITQPGIVVEPTGTRPGAVRGTYTFTTNGVYLVRLTVTDYGGLSNTAIMVGDVEALVVIYDPSAGFVSGSGYFYSPLGALAANPALSADAGFGFVSQYFRNATNPKGNTVF